MTVTPQTNTTLSEIASALAERDHFVIGGHVSPDGDCLGSALGLAWACASWASRSRACLPATRSRRAISCFCPGADGLVPAARFEGPCECFIAVDVPTPERLGDGARAARGGALHGHRGSSCGAPGHERPQLHRSGRRLHVAAHLGAGGAFGRRPRAHHRHLLLHRPHDRHRPLPARQHRRCRVQGGVRNGGRWCTAWRRSPGSSTRTAVSPPSSSRGAP